MKAHTSFLSSFFVGIVLLAGCVPDYKEDITDLKNRVTALENLCSQINGNIASLQSLVAAVQNRNYITAVTPITSGGETTGYTVAFATGDPITIYNGAKGADGSNGQDGHTPQIGVKQDTDGLWYWTVDGEWLLAPDGQKVKAVGEDGKDGTNGTNGTNGINGTNGADGVTPILKIEDDYWYVSTDKGATWTKLDKARGDDGAPGKDGDSFFKSVTQDDSNVYFTLTDNTVITIPKASILEISFDPAGVIALEVGVAEDIAYTVTSALTPVKVEVVSSSNIEVKVTPADEKGLAGTMTVVATSDVNEFSKIVVMVDNGARMTMVTLTPVPYGVENGHKWVDLGLPSGLKWATCNVGAENPEDYGDYFAWGETEPYYSSQNPLTWKTGKSDGYEWTSYRWCNGSNTTMTKYNYSSVYGPVVDRKLTLDIEDDAAGANWGGKWRMPTQTEFNELINSSNCTTEWTTQNEIYGLKITSKNNGNSIFLPASGRRNDTKRLGTGGYGGYGYYWSSSLYAANSSYATYLYFNYGDLRTTSYTRIFGFSVRPVTK